MKTIEPGKGLRGEIDLPGDKSVSIRALIFSALAQGKSEITGLGTGGDIQSAERCLLGLGVAFDRRPDSRLTVAGRGLFGFVPPRDVLDAGNSGTSIRLLAGMLAGQKWNSTLTGDDSLRARPMRRVTEPLKKMGARITGPGDGAFAPLSIEGHPLRGIAFLSPVASAQVKSCILLAGLHAEGETTVTEPALSRDHTERMLAYLGISLERSGNAVTIAGRQELTGGDIAVPGDISSAAFFIAAALIVPGSEILIKNVGINPTRTGILDVVQLMGGNLELLNLNERNNEPVADLLVHSGDLRGITLEGDLIPRVIDEIPIIAVAATQARGETVIRDAAELRVKETDRIAALVKNLRAMGAKVEEREDGMVIPGGQRLRGAPITCFSDHRIVMAFTVAGLVAEGSTILDEEQWADVSFPGFFDVIHRLQM